MRRVAVTVGNAAKKRVRMAKDKSDFCSSLALVGRQRKIIAVGIWLHMHVGFIRNFRFKSQNVADPPGPPAASSFVVAFCKLVRG